MKIMLIGNDSGGMYKFRKELIERIRNEKISVITMTPKNKYHEELESISNKSIYLNLDRRGKNIIKEIKLFYSYFKEIKKQNPDKIITYTIKPNIYCGIISRILNIEFYPNITGLGTAFQKENMFKKIICLAYKFAFKNSKKIFFENDMNNKIFIENKICTHDNSVVLNGAGVNLEEYRYEELPNFETINFIFMGRIMKEKGIDELFYAIRELKKKYTNVRFFILGALEEDYEEEIEKMKEEGLLNYYGMQKDVKKFIKKAHCCILPSHHEGMSNTLLECAAMGRALITSDIPGCKEALIYNKTGFVHRVKDKNSLKDKISKYIELEIEKKIEMGKASRNHIEMHFDKRLVVNKTIENILLN